MRAAQVIFITALLAALLGAADAQINMTFNGVTVANMSTVNAQFGDGVHATDVMMLNFTNGTQLQTIGFFAVDSQWNLIESSSQTVTSYSTGNSSVFNLRWDQAIAPNATAAPSGAATGATTSALYGYIFQGLTMRDNKLVPLGIKLTRSDSTLVGVFYVTLNYSDKPSAAQLDRNITLNGHSLVFPMNTSQRLVLGIAPDGTAMVNISISTSAADFGTNGIYGAMFALGITVQNDTLKNPLWTIIQYCQTKANGFYIGGVQLYGYNPEWACIYNLITYGITNNDFHPSPSGQFFKIGTLAGTTTNNLTLSLDFKNGTFTSLYTSSYFEFQTNYGTITAPTNERFLYGRIFDAYLNKTVITLMYQHPFYSYMIMNHGIPVDVSALNVVPVYTYPCATNKSLESTCTSCDTVRFNASAPNPLNRICGACATGRYGTYCQYTTIDHCNRDECNYYGTCDPAGRRCHCSLDQMDSVFRYRTMFKMGAEKCNLTISQCSQQYCGGSAFCAYNSSSITPSCECGYLAVVEGDHFQYYPSYLTTESNCTTCAAGYYNFPPSWQTQCGTCAVGYYGYTCSSTDARSAVVTDPYPGGNSNYRNCSGNGAISYIDLNSQVATSCICDHGYGGPYCEYPITQWSQVLCGNGTAVKSSDVSFVDTGDVWECDCAGTGKTGAGCNMPLSSTDCGMESNSPSDRMNYALRLSTGCMTCPPTFDQTIAWPHISYPSLAFQYTYGATCNKCKQGYYGQYCNYTDPVVCGAHDCSGNGVCGRSSFWSNVGAHVCVCNTGWTGYTCSIPQSVMNTLNCNGNGTYYNEYHRFYNHSGYCVCNDGSYGPDCSLSASQCSTTYCAGTGTCGNTLFPTFDGTGGQQNTCGCQNNQYDPTGGVGCVQNGTQLFCNGYGNFTQFSNTSFTCNCPSDRAGYFCEQDATQCRNSYCSGNGACSYNGTNGVMHRLLQVANYYAGIIIPPSLACQCDSGFAGPNCAIITTINGVLSSAVVSSSTNTSSTGTTGVLSTDFNSGIVFTINPVTTSSVDPVQEKLKSLKTAKAQFQTQTTTTVKFQCGTGAYDTLSATGVSLTVPQTASFCIDNGVYTSSVCRTAASSVVYLTLANITYGGPLPSVITPSVVSQCTTVLITEQLTGKKLVIVGVYNTTSNTISAIASVNNTAPATINYSLSTSSKPAVNLTTCVRTTGIFTSKDKKFFYVARQNCDSRLAPRYDGFLDIFQQNVNPYTGAVTYSYYTTQTMYALTVPYNWDRAIFFPNAERLFLGNDVIGFNILPRNPTTGLFESGLISAAVLPGNRLAAKTDAILLDSTTTVGLITYQKDSSNSDVTYPLIIDLALYSQGYIQSSVKSPYASITATSDPVTYYNVPYPTAFNPLSLTSSFNITQLAVTTPSRNVTMFIVGRVVVSIQEVYDLSAPAGTPSQIVSLMCANTDASSVVTATTTLCTNFNYQLDSFSPVALNGAIWYSNPLLTGLAWVAVPYPNATSGTQQPVVYILTDHTIVVYGFAVTADNNGNPVPVSTRLQVATIKNTAGAVVSGCVHLAISPDNLVLQAACGNSVIAFNIDPKSYWLTPFTEIDMAVPVGKVAFDPVISNAKTIITPITQSTNSKWKVAVFEEESNSFVSQSVGNQVTTVQSTTTYAVLANGMQAQVSNITTYNTQPNTFVCIDGDVVPDSSFCETFVCMDGTTTVLDPSTCLNYTYTCLNGTLVYNPSWCNNITYTCPDGTTTYNLNWCPVLCPNNVTYAATLAACPSSKSAFSNTAVIATVSAVCGFAVLVVIVSAIVLSKKKKKAYREVQADEEK